MVSITEFLRELASEMVHNDKEFTSEEIYQKLKFVGVNSNNTLHKEIEKFYQDFVNNLANSLVKYEVKSKGKNENTTHYIGFYTDKKAEYKEAVKVYFSVKYEYLISALKTIFLYLVRNNIKATVKFHLRATNEGIVIRFYETKDVMPFVNYCNNNFILRDLLEKVNPFIATIHGLGIVNDDNTANTYNGMVSVLIAEYLAFLKSNYTLDKASDLDFLDFVIRRSAMEGDSALKYDMMAVEKNVKAILNHVEPSLNV